MIRSTLGFIFTPDLQQVLLITKQRPTFHKDKLNGLGGKYEGRECGEDCLTREVQEEAAITVPAEEWKSVGTLNWTEWHVDIFTAIFMGNPTEAQALTNDPVAWYKVNNLPRNIISNLSWLIPLSIDVLTQKTPPKISAEYP